MLPIEPETSDPFMARFSSRNPAKPAVNCSPFPNTSGEPSESTRTYLILSVPARAAAGKAPFQTCEIWWLVRGCLSFLFFLPSVVGSGRIASHATALLFQYITPQKTKLREMHCRRCKSKFGRVSTGGVEKSRSQGALGPGLHIPSSWLSFTSPFPKTPWIFRCFKSRSSLPFKRLDQPFRRVLMRKYTLLRGS